MWPPLRGCLAHCMSAVGRSELCLRAAPGDLLAGSAKSGNCNHREAHREHCDIAFRQRFGWEGMRCASLPAPFMGSVAVAAPHGLQAVSDGWVSSSGLRFAALSWQRPGRALKQGEVKQRIIQCTLSWAC